MKILIFGASVNNVIRCAKVLDFDKINILAFIDNSKEKWNTIIAEGHIYYPNKLYGAYWPLNDIPVISSLELLNYEFDYILIGAVFHTEEIYIQLINMGINKEKILLMMDPDVNLPSYLEIRRFGNNLENAAMFRNTLYSDYNKYFEGINEAIDTDHGIMRFKDLILSLDAFKGNESIFYAEFRDILQMYYFGREIFPYNEGPYELDEMKIGNDDIIIDCGANVGMFSAYAAIKAKNGQIFAFEPFPDALKILNATSAFYSNIRIVKKALSDTKENAKLVLMGELGNSTIINDKQSLQNDENNIEVEVDTIDSFVKDNNIDRVDFIKADIEGAERNMLLGARETIQKYKPKISICTYHLMDDKEVLENIIKDINPEYKIIHRWRKMYAF